MPRQARVAPGGLIYHVLNRGAGRQTLFEDAADYAAFLRAMADVLREDPIRVLGYCLMGNHWHLVLWPQRDGQLARFMQRLTITHVRRWTEHRHRVGWGGGLESDREEHDLFVRILLGDPHGVERRVHDPHVAAVRLDYQQILLGTGHA